MRGGRASDTEGLAGSAGAEINRRGGWPREAEGMTGGQRCRRRRPHRPGCPVVPRQYRCGRALRADHTQAEARLRLESGVWESSRDTSLAARESFRRHQRADGASEGCPRGHTCGPSSPLPKKGAGTGRLPGRGQQQGTCRGRHHCPRCTSHPHRDGSLAQLAILRHHGKLAASAPESRKQSEGHARCLCPGSDPP